MHKLNQLSFQHNFMHFQFAIAAMLQHGYLVVLSVCQCSRYTGRACLSSTTLQIRFNNLYVECYVVCYILLFSLQLVPQRVGKEQVSFPFQQIVIVGRHYYYGNQVHDATYVFYSLLTCTSAQFNQPVPLPAKVYDISKLKANLESFQIRVM